MTRVRRRALAALLGPFLISASLVVLAGPASAAVPLSNFTVSSNHPSAAAGQSVTFFATLTGTSASPTGTVAFFDGGTPLCSSAPLAAGISPTSVAGCTTSSLTVGVHAITVSYAGDGTYSPSLSTDFAPALSQTVAAATTTTVLAPSANPSVFTQPVTVTATVAPVAPGAGTPTGTVSFQDAGVDITGCTTQGLSAGAATCVLSNLAVASHSLTARYSGTSSYITSLSAPVVQAVSAAGTGVVLTSNHNPASASAAVTFHVVVGITGPGTATPTGDVAFFRVRSDLTRAWIATVPLTGGAANTTTSSLPPGANRISAVYRGTDDFSMSNATMNQRIDSGGSRTAVTTSRVSAVARRFIALRAAVTPSEGTGSPTGTVAFFRMRANGTRAWIGNVVITNGVARLRTNTLPVGTYVITAVYRGSSSYVPSTGSVSQTITN